MKWIKAGEGKISAGDSNFGHRKGSGSRRGAPDLSVSVHCATYRHKQCPLDSCACKCHKKEVRNDDRR
jgi:hypothetical protein